ncbi:MAG: hypothetical protein M4579_001071 [Chaenotheca gracillima]|nr:MAG: hypothetical protein M4579_001071 [Chaenotheca gracillima]
MGREDQQEEREVLDSIFPDEITDVSDTEYKISIKLDVEGERGEAEEEPEPPTIILQVTYEEDYPDTAPILDVSTPQNASKHRYLDISTDKPRLLESLEPTVEENLGMAMVFALVSALKDAAEVLIAERQAATRAIQEAEIAKVEEEENKKFHGTMVNRETFMSWRDGFRRELEEAAGRKEAEREAEEKKKRGAKEEKKMTGKELWEKGLVGKLDDEEDDDDEAPGVDGVEEMKKLKVGA